MLLSSAPTFDPHLIEVMLPLTTGGTLVIPARSTLLDPTSLVKLIRDTDISWLSMTPTLFMRFDTEQRRDILQGLTPVKTVILGGEPFPVTLAQMPRNVDLFNIYGTTECSVWATLQIVNDQEVLVGDSLDETVVEVRNIKDNIGELWIGGPQRVCFVGDEEAAARCTKIKTAMQTCTASHLFKSSMRNTGDLVHKDPASGKITFSGRGDNQIKLSGYRICLEAIADVLDRNHAVIRSEVVTRTLSEGETLVAFVAIGASVLSDVAGITRLRSEIDAQLMRDMPFYSRPEDIRFVAELPMTPHGKADRAQLTMLAGNDPPSLTPRTLSHPSLPEETRQHVLNVVGHYLPQLHQSDPDDVRSRWFLAEGGTSIDATRLLSDIVGWIALLLREKTLSDPLQKRIFSYILHRTIDDLANFVTEIVHPLKTAPKNVARNASEAFSPYETNVAFVRPIKRLRSGGDYACFNRAMDATPAEDGTVEPGTEPISVVCQWRVDLGKCVDASPVIYAPGVRPAVAFIGSHSGVFAAIEVDTGKTLWKTQLGGRIESSACVIPGGTMVIVGCYDGNIYALNAASGTIAGKYRTGAEVK
ncbi:hypothetical protein HKX48_000553 [Thoreauomyces humboldtii]|nr:hypothetical protein HKX48_000553 [Thoreauomyces humboldtii]